MSGRRFTHQLSNGMFVSGPPEPPPKERSPTVGSRAVPYTGGDVRKSGELGKMFDISVAEGPSLSGGGLAVGGSGGGPKSGSRPHSGPLPRSAPSSGSGPVPQRKTSGPLSQIPATGLITSGPARRSGGQGTEQSPAPTRKKKGVYGSAVTVVEDKGFAFGVSRVWAWVLAVMFVVGLAAGAFVWVAVGRPEILIGVAAVMAAVGAVAAWNWAVGRRELERFLRSYPNTPIDPRNLPIGKFVKITGHVTCGSVPLETTYQNVSRCIYASTELHEYRGWNGLPANNKHGRWTWGLRSSERHVADFYISDPNTGTRFLVRAGNGIKVVAFVKPATLLKINKENKELNPDFQTWLGERNLSSEDRVMCLKEGYIKEGDTASIMGVLRKHENLIMIDPPADVISTGCQWRRCFFPMFVEGLILIGDDERPEEVVYQV